MHHQPYTIIVLHGQVEVVLFVWQVHCVVCAGMRAIISQRLPADKKLNTRQL
jgi:hypothetical protein